MKMKRIMQAVEEGKEEFYKKHLADELEQLHRLKDEAAAQKENNSTPENENS